MEAIKTSSFSSLNFSMIPTNSSQKPIFFLPFKPQLPNSSVSLFRRNNTKFKLFSTISTEHIDPISPEVEVEGKTQKFDWFAHWYPISPICDLDKRVPHAKKVMGLDIVVWWDRNEKKWQVFDDKCPHRLAPLSEGRIDQWGRLQCVYHGWCFNGNGDCKFIPQAPKDGPPVHTFKKACAAAYPCLEQNQLLWFWPNTASQYKDIAMKVKPPYISEIDDPAYISMFGSRDIPFGYEILVENLMDPAHVPYAHYKILQEEVPVEKADREGGRHIEINVKKLDINGFLANKDNGYCKFIPPCVIYFSSNMVAYNESLSTLGIKEELSKNERQQRDIMLHICVPVSPGRSRFIWAFPRNYGVWYDRVIPRWMIHVEENLILDSDLCLLHLEERRLFDVGFSNWQNACFVPTKADGLVVAFRKWLRKYSGYEVDWGTKFSTSLPPSPPREQLMDRYRTHVVNCSSCQEAIKGLKALEFALPIISIGLLGVIAVKQGVLSMAAKTVMVSIVVLCFAASKWLSQYIYKSFYFHDYSHALV